MTKKSIFYMMDNISEKSFINFLLFNMSFTYNPKKRKRVRTHGFRKRQRTAGGKRTLVRRRRKKRWKLAV